MDPLAHKWCQATRPRHTAHSSWRRRAQRQPRTLPETGPVAPSRMRRQPTSIQTLASHSRKPSGAHRAGQRSGERQVSRIDGPVDPWRLLWLLNRRWRGKMLGPNPWRMRGLAVIAVALAAPPGSTTRSLCEMRPGDVLALKMPPRAWLWVLRWLHFRRQILGPTSDHQPWGSSYGSNGVPRQMCWAAMQTQNRRLRCAWSLSQLLRSTWNQVGSTVPFDKVVNKLLPWDSPLRALQAW